MAEPAEGGSEVRSWPRAERLVVGWGPQGVAPVAKTWWLALHTVTGPALAAPSVPQRPTTAAASPAALRGEPVGRAGTGRRF